MNAAAPPSPCPDVFAETAQHPLPDGAVTLLGAVSAVTGAMTRVEIGGRAILVDCGIAQGEEARRWRMPAEARDVDAIVLTHGHNDHVGSLPALLEAGFAGPIFATRTTLAIAELVLSDGLRLQRASARAVNAFIERLRALSRPIDYDTPFAPGDLAAQVYLREAGHILGSSSVELQSESSRVIISGDLGRPDSPILPDYNTRWQGGRPVDLAIVETTYGAREHAMSHKDVEDALERIVNRAARDGGHVLVPAFAIGRTQTLLYHLNTLVEAGRVPDMLVAIDSPLGARVTELYQASRHLFDREAAHKLQRGDDPLDFRDLYTVGKARDSARLRDVKTPTLIIAGSGMCTGGRIVGHLQELLPRAETCVVLVGYQAQGTPGRAIQQARPGERIWLEGEEVVVNASVETLSGLSAHADRNELLRWIHALPAPRRLGLHHGEPDQQRQFADWVRQNW